MFRQASRRARQTQALPVALEIVRLLPHSGDDEVIRSLPDHKDIHIPPNVHIELRKCPPFFVQAYGVVYVVFSIFWFYLAPEEDKYLYEGILDWDQNRQQACIWVGVSLVVVVPLAALPHFALFR